jgi:hypothetical protein
MELSYKIETYLTGSIKFHNYFQHLNLYLQSWLLCKNDVSYQFVIIRNLKCCYHKILYVRNLKNYVTIQSYVTFSSYTIV